MTNASNSDVENCRRCAKPVVVNRDRYSVFEGMHWLCFHLEFEHASDPDEPCADPSCPWWQIEVYKSAIESLGGNAESALVEAISKRWNLRKAND